MQILLLYLNCYLASANFEPLDVNYCSSWGGGQEVMSTLRRVINNNLIFK